MDENGKEFSRTGSNEVDKTRTIRSFEARNGDGMEATFEDLPPEWEGMKTQY